MNRLLYILVCIVLFASCAKNEAIEITMEQRGGVYVIPCKVNDIPMDFIFDTGASDVCISITEAEFLYKQNKLSNSDFHGMQYSQIANGDIISNASVTLHCIEIGGLILDDVRAKITLTNNAPLLLGQTAISKLGRISIEGNKLIIHKDNEKSKMTCITKCYIASNWCSNNFVKLSIIFYLCFLILGIPISISDRKTEGCSIGALVALNTLGLYVAAVIFAFITPMLIDLFREILVFFSWLFS